MSSHFADLTEFFGDKEHSFRITFNDWRELHRTTGHKPYRLYRNLLDGEWAVQDIREVIRVGLIGGGMSPQESFNITRTYVELRPPLETLPLAIKILGSALVGPEGETKPGKQDPEREETASPSPVL